MIASELIKTIAVLSENKVPVFLWGAPGVGKSSLIKQITDNKKIGFIDLRLALMDPTDLKGIPFYDKKMHTALWAPPVFLPKKGKGILFLDELNVAAPSVQASAYQLILDRKVGEYSLPDGWSIVAAGNREEDRGITYKMPSPLANRFVHFEMDVDVNEWKSWAYTKKIDKNIISYISYKNEHLFTFDAKEDVKSFATPRSWEYVDSIIKSSLPKNLELNAISGAVGKEVAVSFLGFCKVVNRLPDIDTILKTGEGEYTQEIDVLYALSVALVSGVLQDESKIDNLLKYTLKLKSEFAVMIIQDLQRNSVNMEHSEVFQEWVKKFMYLLE